MTHFLDSRCVLFASSSLTRGSAHCLQAIFTGSSADVDMLSHMNNILKSTEEHRDGTISEFDVSTA
eukprot:SAG11_NODE_213_length_12262_cov_8.391597_2_plen_66_part_00